MAIHPSLSTKPSIHLLGSQVNVSLSLVGENASPVTAKLTVFQRSSTNVSSTALVTELHEDEALYWDVGEYGSLKTVTVTLPQAVSCQSGLRLGLGCRVWLQLEMMPQLWTAELLAVSSITISACSCWSWASASC